MRWCRWLLFLVVLVQRAETAASPRPSSAVRPNIILITLDTTRADRMGFLGSTRGLTPNLDALARQSVVFTRAYAQVPLTTPSHANILTGTYSQFNHVDYMGKPITEDLPYLPDILRHRQYKTAAFVGSIIVDAKTGVASGFDRGFDTYNAPFHNRVKGEDPYKSVERRADEVVDHALAWVSSDTRGPFFLWVHCYDPHAPYDPPAPYKARYASEPYDGEIAYTDSAMGRLFAGLRARGVYDGALIAVMADHGEGLGEHSERHHGVFLYDGTIHVPLLFKMPGQRFAGTRIAARARLVDVAPTILEDVGIPVPSAMQGESLIDMIKLAASGQPGALPDRPAYSESDYGRLAFGWSVLRSWRTSKYLYVDAPERELYDEATDPSASHNLAPDLRAVADTMQSQSEQFRRGSTRADTSQTNLSMEQLESLRALGYVGTNLASAVEGSERGPDPKGKMDVADLLEEALFVLQDDDFEAAMPKLEEVLKLEPNTPLATLEMGRALVHLKEPQKALPYLRAAVEKIPQDGMARFLLGRALVETGSWDDAVPQFEAAVTHNLKSPELHFYLAVAYERTHKIPEAMGEFQETTKLNPNHFRANLLLGRLLGMQGNGAEALRYLQQATTIDPKSVEAHMFLANVYAELGQTKNADRERAIMGRLKSTRPN